VVPLPDSVSRDCAARATLGVKLSTEDRSLEREEARRVERRSTATKVGAWVAHSVDRFVVAASKAALVMTRSSMSDSILVIIVSE